MGWESGLQLQGRWGEMEGLALLFSCEKISQKWQVSTKGRHYEEPFHLCFDNF